MVFFATGGVAEELGARGLGPSRTGLWTVRLLLGFVYAALVAGVELWVAFSLVGVEHEASTMQVHLFLASPSPRSFSSPYFSWTAESACS